MTTKILKYFPARCFSRKFSLLNEIISSAFSYRTTSVRLGGDDGSIKDSGGKWSEREEAFENEFFWRKNRDLLEELKKELDRRRKKQHSNKDTEQKNDGGPPDSAS